MMNFKKWFMGLAALLLISTGVSAQERGSKEEAQAMTQAAAEHVKKVGIEQASKDFSDKSNKQWRNKDLYVFAYDLKGNCLAHGANEKLIGKNWMDMKDVNGKLVIQELTKTAANSGSGWVDYDWPDPNTKQVLPKSTYVSKVSNFDGFVGVGAYRN